MNGNAPGVNHKKEWVVYSIENKERNLRKGQTYSYHARRLDSFTEISLPVLPPLNFTLSGLSKRPLLNVSASHPVVTSLKEINFLKDKTAEQSVRQEKCEEALRPQQETNKQSAKGKEKKKESDTNLITMEKFSDAEEFKVLQRLAKEPLASANLAVQTLWPYLYSLDFNIDGKYEYCLLFESSKDKSKHTEICVNEPCKTRVTQRSCFDLMIKVKKIAKNGEKGKEKKRSMGRLWLETSVDPSPENTYSLWVISLAISNLILMRKVPNKYRKHRDMIERYRRKIIQQLFNHTLATPIMDNGSLLIPEKN